MRTLLTLSVVLAAGVATDLNAQANAKPAPSKPDPACVTFPEGRVECVKFREMLEDSSIKKIFRRSDSTMMKRAALGLELRATGTRRDTLGVFVTAVTKGGPAETAGIIEGDRIAAINGVDLRSVAADVDDAYTNGVPSHRLMREVQKVTPGTKVTLRVYSGGRIRDVVVTTGRASDVMRHAGPFNFRMDGPGDFEFRGPNGAMMLSPRPLRVERFKRPGGGTTQIKTVPRKTQVEISA